MQKYEYRSVMKSLYLILNDTEDKNREKKALEILKDALEQTYVETNPSKKKAVEKNDK